MAVTTLPTCAFQAIAGKRFWFYESTDDAATADTSAYLTNGYAAGMRQGDVVVVLDTNSTHQQITMHSVKTATTTAVNLSDGVSVGGAADTD